jgi:ATP-dependent DNA helicase RecQ
MEGNRDAFIQGAAQQRGGLAKKTSFASNAATKFQKAYSGSMHIQIALEKVFHLSEFRTGQREVIEAAVSGRDVLGVMPTGAGKSLTYQLPAVVSSGLTIVVSPLIALMRDQVANLERRGVLAAALHSGMSQDEQDQTLTRASSLKLFYLAPERLRSKAVLERLTRLKIARLVIDEAHCVSQWGHDFRPDYQLLGEARAALGHPPTTAVTATATLAVQDDIIQTLALQDPFRLVTGFDRPNLAYRVFEVLGDSSKQEALHDLLKRLPKPGLVYAGTRREAEDLALELQRLGLRASCYHAALETSARNAVQDAFLSGKLEVVIATNAFGMGVDKRDVRFVIHHRIPGTLEAYYQEAGRAGRDGKPSQCWLLFDPKDRELQMHFIETSTPSQHELKRLWAYFHAARDEQDRISLRVFDLERNLQIPSNKIRVGYQHLETVGALERLPAQGGFLKAKIAQTPPDFRIQTLEELKKRKTAMLEQMLHFASAQQCRRRSILQYFGESSQVPDCRQCDVCQPNPTSPWVRRTLEHLRGVKSEFWRKPNLLRIIKEVNPQYSAPELERLLADLQNKGYLDQTQRLTPQALLVLEQPVEALRVLAEVSDAVLEEFRSGVPLPEIATKHGVHLPAIEKRLERALERGELEPSECIGQKRLGHVRSVAEEVGFSPLAKLQAALPDYSKLELKAARMLLE